MAGLCNHLDSDGDEHGDSCDTCPFTENPNQTTEGIMQVEDADGDFVGKACEQECAERPNPRPFGFYRVKSPSGFCCTIELVEAETDTMGDPDDPNGFTQAGDLLLARTCRDPNNLNGETCDRLRAPDFEAGNAVTFPVRTAADCSVNQEVNGECKQLPPSLADPTISPQAMGVLVLAPGCEDALADAGLTALENTLTPLTDADFAGSADAFDDLWQNMCFLPQVDQDFDGYPDPCDLCPYVFDPLQTPFTNEAGRLYTDAGQLCNGAFAPDAVCEAMEGPEPGAGEETGTGGGGVGGSSGGGGSGG